MFEGLEPGDSSQEFEEAFGAGCALSQLKIDSRGFFAMTLIVFSDNSMKRYILHTINPAINPRKKSTLSD